MQSLFISDLHLEPQASEINLHFERFINHCLRLNQQSTHYKIDSLYILGDLFETWIGDDASIEIYLQSINLLKTLVNSGTSIYIMHGNRDFLMAEEFEQFSQCQLIPDLCVMKNNTGQNVLLSHGDIFCTDDHDYMKLRQVLRDPQWQQDFLAQTINERIAIAQSLRSQSKQSGQTKSEKITDINQDSVQYYMSEKNAHLLIHGHTHRQNIHHFHNNNQPYTRIVLPDWRPQAEIYSLNTQIFINPEQL